MQRSLLGPAGRETSAVKPALLAKGFRPFFLLAAMQVALAMPIWLFALGGTIDLGTYFGATFWHAHEMIFGFAVAVISGFLLTAVGNWTGKETATGVGLAWLAGLWVIGRVASLLAPRLPHPVAAVLDLAFLPALTFACARPIVATGNKRNLQFVVMLALLFGANLGMHLGALGVAPAWIRRGAWVGVDVIVLMIVVMSARVVPMFTKNATRVERIRNLPALDRAASTGAFALVLLDASAEGRLAAVVAAVTGLFVLARSATWGSRHTLRHPLLWVLHAGHAFVALGMLLRGLALVWPALALSTALHALTAGAIGLLTLGMMARVSLGHSGRMLTVGPAMSVSFGCVLVAALVRVVGPLFGPAAFHPTMITAGSLFALGFGIYLVVYLPILASPRVDGKPG